MIETLVIDYLRRTIRPEARREHSQSWVEYGYPFKALVLLFWLFSLGIAALTHYGINIERKTGLITTFGFCFVALLLHLEFYRTRVLFSIVELKSFSPWRRTIIAPWNDIVSVSFSNLSQNWVVMLKGGKRFTFNYFMNGYASLINELEDRLNDAQPGVPADGLASLGRR